MPMSDPRARTKRGVLPGLARLIRRVRRVAYIDIGPPEATIFVAGMGRSGTTWISALVNHDFRHRIIFEPFRPEVVPVATVFGPFAYLRPGDRDTARVAAAQAILAGRTPRGAVDRHHRGMVFRRRIVKAVRANLMLGWFRSIRPAMPIVLVVRNPFAVAASWMQLGWGTVADGVTLELDVILSHPELIEDFPEIPRLLADVDRSDPFERTVAQWCALHLVPMRQLVAGDVHVIHYEDLLLDPSATIARLGKYLGQPIEGESRDRALRKATATDFLNRGDAPDRSALLTGWADVLTQKQVERGHGILGAFGLDDMYDERGLPATMREPGHPLP
jgi:hypothetical protein